MEWIEEEKIWVLSLVDLEHMGFDHDMFMSEMFMNGFFDRSADMLCPDMVVVNFKGGAIITPDTSETTLDVMGEATNRFMDLVKRLIGQDLFEKYFPE